MSDQDLLLGALARMLSDHATDIHQPGLNQSLWDELVATGLAGVGISEAVGGSGGDDLDVYEILFNLGRNASSVPFAEHWMAGRLLDRAQLELPAGTLVAATQSTNDRLVADPVATGWHLRGDLFAVPWAAVADYVVVVVPVTDGTLVAAVPLADAKIEPSENMANEGRDDLHLDVEVPNSLCAVLSDLEPDLARQLGAMARTASAAGALTKVTELVSTHVAERNQFGRPLDSFQVVRQTLAQLYAEAVASTVASRSLFTTAEALPSAVAVAAAKARVGQACGNGAAMAHQMMGAIGFTKEHSLHLYTTRLWSWRDEFGNQASWEALLGAKFFDAGADAWQLLVDGHLKEDARGQGG